MSKPAKAYDAIIVGAGPAGATAAFELARRGVDVLIIERSKLPRYKLCGGGVTWRAVKQLPFDISSIVHKTLRQVTLLRNGSPRLVIRSDEPLVCMTMRDELDSFLATRACEQGSKLVDSQSVTQIMETKDGYQIETQSTRYRCQAVIGADGAHSQVARSIGLRNKPILGLGLEAEIPIGAQQMPIWQESLCIDLGRLRKGYGWIFPKRDHFSIGAAGEELSYSELKAYYDQFVGDTLGRGTPQPRPLGHFLPLRKRNMPIQKHRALLIGDAAGLIDPFTGEGIFYAIRSAQLAADDIWRVLTQRQIDLSYERRIDEELMPQLASSLVLSRLLAALPDMALRMLAHRRAMQTDLCQIIRGEKNSSAAARWFGPLQFLFGLASHLVLPRHQLQTD